jgi:hypothetical protein
MPVLESGHDSDLVFDDGHTRVWRSRMTIEDFDGDKAAWERERVVVEKKTNGRWARASTDTGKRAVRAVESAPVDEAAVDELRLFAENTGEIYKQKQAVIANLQKIADRGKYDPEKAPLAWQHWVEVAVKQFAREEGADEAKRFTPAVRRALAVELARDFEQRPRGEGVELPRQDVEADHAPRLPPGTSRG